MVLAMEQGTMVIQGRRLSEADIKFIRQLLAENPSWHRTRLSCELCTLWDWRNDRGRLKDMACRSLLLKLEQAGHLVLPPRRRPSINHLRNHDLQEAPHRKEPIRSRLRERTPIDLMPIHRRDEQALFATFLSQYHYLGYTGSVGENLKYLIFDRQGQPLACSLFGSAAWRVAPRDRFIGWDDTTRRARLHLITNQMRFLILPWVQVPHLASHLLSRVAKRIRGDWVEKYGHPVHLLETFVERDRFRGTCYQAANWLCVGETTGRTRNDRVNAVHAPRKAIYVYPLTRHFRKDLGGDA